MPVRTVRTEPLAALINRRAIFQAIIDTTLRANGSQEGNAAIRAGGRRGNPFALVGAGRQRFAAQLHISQVVVPLAVYNNDNDPMAKCALARSRPIAGTPHSGHDAASVRPPQVNIGCTRILALGVVSATAHPTGLGITVSPCTTDQSGGNSRATRGVSGKKEDGPLVFPRRPTNRRHAVGFALAPQSGSPTPDDLCTDVTLIHTALNFMIALTTLSLVSVTVTFATVLTRKMHAVSFIYILPRWVAPINTCYDTPSNEGSPTIPTLTPVTVAFANGLVGVVHLQTGINPVAGRAPHAVVASSPLAR